MNNMKPAANGGNKIAGDFDNKASAAIVPETAVYPTRFLFGKLTNKPTAKLSKESVANVVKRASTCSKPDKPARNGSIANKKAAEKATALLNNFRVSRKTAVTPTPNSPFFANRWARPVTDNE